MLINSLAAMLLGYILDLMFGDMGNSWTPVSLMRRLTVSISGWLKNRYVDSRDGQKLAGSLLVFFMLVIFVGISVALLVVAYKIHVVVGVIVESFICWSVISSKTMAEKSTQVIRALRGGRLLVARKKLALMTYTDTSKYNEEQIVKNAVEMVSLKTYECGVAPLFFMLIGGGIGGVLYTTINIINDCLIGNDNKYFRVASKGLNDLLGFLPARIAALLMICDAKFLGLNSHNAYWIWRRDRKNSDSMNNANTVAACAGALEIEVVGDTYGGEWNENEHIGDPIKPCEIDDIYWAAQLCYGTVFMSLVIFALLKLLIHLIF